MLTKVCTLFCAEDHQDDLSFGQGGSKSPDPAPLLRPVAVRSSLASGVDLSKLFPAEDICSVPLRPVNFATGEHTPRVAAAKRDLYGRVNEHTSNNKSMYALNDQNARGWNQHHLDPVLSRPDTATGSSLTSATVSS